MDHGPHHDKLKRTQNVSYMACIMFEISDYMTGYRTITFLYTFLE
jgi:hypothetical protein